MRHFLPIFVKIGWVVFEYGLILLTDMQTDASEKITSLTEVITLWQSKNDINITLYK